MPVIDSAVFEGRGGARAALLIAALCAIGLAVTWVLAELVPITHFKDAVALYDLTRLNRPFVEVPANALLDLLYPAFYVLWGIALVAVALRRRRPALTLVVAVVLALAPLSAELLKPLLAHSHDQLGSRYIDAASWPSGHATAATALAWCALLVAPPARRRLVAFAGTSFALAVGIALLVLAWHMPSDVVGGYLLATLWAAMAVAVLCARKRQAGPERRPRNARERLRRAPLEPIAAPLGRSGDRSRRG